MTSFQFWDSYGRFARSIKHSARYVLTEESNRFLAAVTESGSSRKQTFPMGRILWRAQRGNGWERIDKISDAEAPRPHDPQRMMPLPFSAKEGRVNPKGIPCLYLNSDRETAMSEVRPWLGEAISVAQFKTVKPLVLIDCRGSVSASTRLDWYFTPPPQEELEAIAWSFIGEAFSTPVSPDDAVADYAPTQIIAESLRNIGVDGIVYQSMLGKGANMALFDIHAAKLLNCFLFETTQIEFKFQEIANPYFRREEFEGND